MAIELKMPALSPTMEEGTLAKWLVKEGDSVKSGDILAEIETDKATMEFEAVDEGVITSISVPEGTDGVKVGTVIALIQGEDEASAPAAKAAAPAPVAAQPAAAAPAPATQAPAAAPVLAPKGDRVVASPLAKRIAEQRGVDLTGLAGSGPNGRIIKAMQACRYWNFAGIFQCLPAVTDADRRSSGSRQGRHKCASTNHVPLPDRRWPSVCLPPFRGRKSSRGWFSRGPPGRLRHGMPRSEHPCI